MKTFEEILDSAVTKLQKGTPLSEVLLQYSEEKQRLEPILKNVQELLSLPKNQVPRPEMKRRYLTELKAFSLFSILRFSPWLNIGFATLVAIGAVFSTTYATARSLPGEMLFPVKRTAEKIQLRFADNDVDKATIQVSITKKRLAEAQQIFNQENKNEKQELAALNELSKETQQTLEAVKTAAATSAIHEKNHPIVASLEQITSDQNDLFKNLETEGAIAIAANSASDSSKQAKAIKQLIEVIAATNDQTTLITLDPDPSSVLTSGTISTSTKTSLTIEKTTFTVNQETVIKDTKGNKTTLPAAGARATIKGLKDSSTGKLFAKEITVDINSTSSSTTTPETIKPNSTTSGSTTPVTKPTTTVKEETTNKSPTTIGTFIPEDPAPQFK